jgi:hypothetical protein
MMQELPADGVKLIIDSLHEDATLDLHMDNVLAVLEGI